MKTFIAVWQHRLLILVIALLVSGSNVSFAQSSQGPKDDIDAQRVGFITREVGLTTAEAQVFWPVYNKYRQDLELLRKGRSTELMAAKVNFDEYTNEEVSRIIENDFTYRQKELDLMIKYNEEFKKILPVKKVAKLYRADQLFKIYMIKDLKLDKSGTGVPDPKSK
jgi:hypothetical protein